MLPLNTGSRLVIQEITHTLINISSILHLVTSLVLSIQARQVLLLEALKFSLGESTALSTQQLAVNRCYGIQVLSFLHNNRSIHTLLGLGHQILTEIYAGINKWAIGLL